MNEYDGLLVVFNKRGTANRNTGAREREKEGEIKGCRKPMYDQNTEKAQESNNCCLRQQKCDGIKPS